MSRWKAAASKSRIVFSHRRVALVWRRSGEKLSFAGLYEAGSRKRGFSFGEAAPLWRLELRDRAGYPTRLDGTAAKGFSYSTGSALVLRWRRMAGGLCDVVIRISADEARPITRWRLEVVNRSPAHTVWSITFPALPEALGPARSHRDDVLVTSEGFGCAIPDPIRQERLSVWGLKSYPSGMQAMGFAALLNGGLGLYVGSHDPDFALREFDIHTDRAADRLSMQIEIIPEDSGRAQKKVAPAGETVLGLFEGNWFDAAAIYREWAAGQRAFRTPIARRRDIPQWARQIPLWLQLGLSNEPKVSREEMRRKADAAVALRKALGCDIAIHLYSWHRNPFDICYPSYLPRPGVRDFVARLQRGGVRVMPYINGRLFDPDNPDWQREGARRWAVKRAGAKLRPSAEHLLLEDYGSHALFAAMCPATRYWQRKIAGVVCEIVEGLGVDGVYIDQIAACGPAACADPRHGHTLRSGPWWVQGYERMFEELHRRLARSGKEVLLTTECNAEAYVGFIGGFLMWHSLRNFIVPLFSVVHGGHVLMFGRSTGLKERAAFRIGAAQNALWGCQMGWFGIDDAERLLKPELAKDLAFLKRLCALYARMQPYVHAGRMCRPPTIEGKVKQTRAAWSFGGCTWRETLPVIQAACWELGGSTVAALVNAGTQAQTVRLTSPRVSARPTSTWWVGGLEGKLSVSRGAARIHMPPLSALVLTAQR